MKESKKRIVQKEKVIENMSLRVRKNKKTSEEKGEKKKRTKKK